LLLDFPSLSFFLLVFLINHFANQKSRLGLGLSSLVQFISPSSSDCDMSPTTLVGVLLIFSIGLADSQVWTTASLSEARYQLASTSVGVLAFFGGGENNTDNVTARVDVFNSTRGVWTTATLSVARSQLAATTVGGLVLFGGGRNKTC